NYPVKTERIRDVKKILMFVIIGLLLIVTVIGVGGKIYIDKKAEQKEAEKIKAEKMSVETLKNTYEDIKSEEFEKSGHNDMTVSYRMFVQMTIESDESVKFSYSYWMQSNEIGSYGVENRKIQVKGVTKNKIHVMYSNRKEEEI